MTHITTSESTKKAGVTGYYLLPVALRNFVRSRETGVVFVAIVIGLLSGLLVAAISKLSEVAHALLFDIPFDAHLSATGIISWHRTLLIPILGGIVLAAVGMSIATQTDLPLSTLAQQKQEFLLPDASIRDIMTAFERSEADVLVVIDRPDHRHGQRSPCVADLWRGARAAQSGTVLQISGALRAASPYRSG